MKTPKTKIKKSKQIAKKTRPKNVWNAVRKLEGHLKKADIQATILTDSLYELRAAVSIDIKKEIVQKLCNTVNGDLLHALFEQKVKAEKGQDSGHIEENAIMIGILEALEQVLDLTPYRSDGERLTVSKETVRAYDFYEYPESLDNNDKKLEVEILRCGWKINGKLVIRPKVFEVRNNERIRAGISEG